MLLEPNERKQVYEYMRSQGYPHLTVKILLGYQPDGMDRMTIMLGKGSEYDYQLIENAHFRRSELKRILKISKKSTVQIN